MQVEGAVGPSRDLRNCSYHTRAKFNNCLILFKIFPSSFEAFLPPRKALRQFRRVFMSVAFMPEQLSFRAAVLRDVDDGVIVAIYVESSTSK